MLDPSHDRWLAFYLGHGFDDRGRTVERIWAFNDRSLEHVHDYIQWLFPLRVRSGYNPEAPLLTDEHIEAVRVRPELRTRLLVSLSLMLRFYGFELRYDEQGKPTVQPDDERYDERTETWLRPHNHNYLRISRILGCLAALGLGAEAQAFLAALEQLYEIEEDQPRGNRIGARSLDFWRRAASGSV